MNVANRLGIIITKALMNYHGYFLSIASDILPATALFVVLVLVFALLLY